MYGKAEVNLLAGNWCKKYNPKACGVSQIKIDYSGNTGCKNSLSARHEENLMMQNE